MIGVYSKIRFHLLNFSIKQFPLYKKIRGFKTMVSHEEMIKEIKKHLKKQGFEEKGKTENGITIFKKKDKEDSKI